MENTEHYRKLENMMHSAPFMQLTEARVKITKAEAEMVMPVKEQLFHAAGALHGSLYFMALDNAAYFAVSSLVTDAFILTTSFTTYLTRPVSSGQLLAVGKVVNQNRTQFIAESILYDDREREIARANGVFMRSKIPLSPDIGYQ